MLPKAMTTRAGETKTPVLKLDAILVMLDEGVHGTLLRGKIPGAYRRERLSAVWPFPNPPGLFKICWYGRRPTSLCWECTPSLRPFPSRRLTGCLCRCGARRYPSGQHRRGVPPSWESRQARFMNVAEGSVEECR